MFHLIEIDFIVSFDRIEENQFLLILTKKLKVCTILFLIFQGRTFWPRLTEGPTPREISVDWQRWRREEATRSPLSMKTSITTSHSPIQFPLKSFDIYDKLIPYPVVFPAMFYMFFLVIIFAQLIGVYYVTTPFSLFANLILPIFLFWIGHTLGISRFALMPSEFLDYIKPSIMVGIATYLWYLKRSRGVPSASPLDFISPSDWPFPSFLWISFAHTLQWSFRCTGQILASITEGPTWSSRLMYKRGCFFLYALEVLVLMVSWYQWTSDNNAGMLLSVILRDYFLMNSALAGLFKSICPILFAFFCIYRRYTWSTWEATQVRCAEARFSSKINQELAEKNAKMNDVMSHSSHDDFDFSVSSSRSSSSSSNGVHGVDSKYRVWCAKSSDPICTSFESVMVPTSNTPTASCTPTPKDNNFEEGSEVTASTSSPSKNVKVKVPSQPRKVNQPLLFNASSLLSPQPSVSNTSIPLSPMNHQQELNANDNESQAATSLSQTKLDTINQDETALVDDPLERKALNLESDNIKNDKDNNIPKRSSEESEPNQKISDSLNIEEIKNDEDLIYEALLREDRKAASDLTNIVNNVVNSSASNATQKIGEVSSQNTNLRKRKKKK